MKIHNLLVDVYDGVKNRKYAEKWNEYGWFINYYGWILKNKKVTELLNGQSSSQLEENKKDQMDKNYDNNIKYWIYK